MKKIFLLVLGVVISFSVYAEGEIKVYKLTKIESSTDSDQDDLKKGIFIIKDTADKHCYNRREWEADNRCNGWLYYDLFLYACIN